MKRSDKFIKNVSLMRDWFKWEEIEVTDQILGRMAVRFGKAIDKAEQRGREEALDFIEVLIEAEKIGNISINPKTLQAQINWARELKNQND